jgi:hypothetical protein
VRGYVIRFNCLIRGGILYFGNKQFPIWVILTDKNSFIKIEKVDLLDFGVNMKKDFILEATRLKAEWKI